MGTCFNFESSYDIDRGFFSLYFNTEDRTEWRVTEKWRLSNKGNGMQQRITFKKLNNYQNQYDLQMEIFSVKHNASYVIRRFRRAKPIRTSFVTSLLNLQKLGYSNSSSREVYGINTKVDVTTDIFRFKVTIRRAHELLRIPCLGNWRIFSDQFRWLLNNKVFSDGELLSCNDVFHIQKCLLMCRSNLFFNIYKTNRICSEALEESQRRINMDKIDDYTIRVVLNFLYGGIPEPVNIDDTAQLYAVACGLQMEYYRDICRMIIKDTIDFENAANLLCTAHYHNDFELKAICIEYIARNFDDVTELDSSWRIVEESLPMLKREILKRRRLLGRRYKATEFYGSPELPQAKR